MKLTDRVLSHETYISPAKLSFDVVDDVESAAYEVIHASFLELLPHFVFVTDDLVIQKERIDVLKCPAHWTIPLKTLFKC